MIACLHACEKERKIPEDRSPGKRTIKVASHVRYLAVTIQGQIKLKTARLQITNLEMI